jgi:D-tyrosyl-tRNA(Tyr) deacylase
MKALIQRVTHSAVDIEGKTAGETGNGLLIFLGVMKGDTEKDLAYLLKKIPQLRIFEDERNKLNLSVTDISGEILVISQFTLSADCRKGNRPSFESAEEPGKAQEMYLRFIDGLQATGLRISSGKFGAHMRVHLTNDGPVTIMLDSKA